MHDVLHQQLGVLIDKYGLDVLDASQTVATELHQACPDHCADVDRLVAALRHGVVHCLLVLAEAGKLKTADLSAQARRLATETEMHKAEAQEAVDTWAKFIGSMPIPSTSPWQREPSGLHTRFYGLGEVLIVGVAGLVASMLPWLMVLQEKHGGYFLLPVGIDQLASHTLLNLLGALGGFLGGALGWMLGSPLSLEFSTSRSASARRVSAACLAAAVGSFFGLWLGYQHFADVGAFFGPLLAAGLGAFVATIYTFDSRSVGV
jgi:hypothetical protein